MSLSNYPSGVTGNEWQIAGPDFEREETRNVDACDYFEDDCNFDGGDVEGESWGDHSIATFWWECPGCGREKTLEYNVEQPERDAD